MASKVHRRNRRPRVCVCPEVVAADFIYVRGIVFIPGAQQLIIYTHSLLTLGEPSDFNTWGFQDFSGPADVVAVDEVAPGAFALTFDDPFSDFLVFQPPVDSPAAVAAGPLYFPNYAFVSGDTP